MYVDIFHPIGWLDVSLVKPYEGVSPWKIFIEQKGACEGETQSYKDDGWF